MSNYDTGMFVFEGVFQAISSIPSDAGKWRMFKAIFDYETKGILPAEKLLNSGIFLLVKAISDGRKSKAQKEIISEQKKPQNSYPQGYFRQPKSNKIANPQTPQKSDQKIINKNINKNINIKNNKNSSSTSRPLESIKPVPFAVPTSVDDVEKFVREANLVMNPSAFFEYYKAKNWCIDGREMYDWRSCAIEWARREAKFKKSSAFSTRDNNETDLNNLFDNLDNIEI